MDRNKTVALVAASAAGLLALTGTPAAAQSGNATPTPPVNNTVTNTDKGFIIAAAQGNMAEVMTSQLALKKTKMPAVVTIANMLIAEHSKAQQDLKPVAHSAGVPMPKAPNPKQRAMYRMLSRLNGTAFDKAYMSGQVKSHLETIGLFQKENRTGRDREATNYAATYLPAIQNHTSMIVEAAKVVRVPLSQAARQYEKRKPNSGAMGNMRMNNGAAGSAAGAGSGGAGTGTPQH